MAIATLLLTMTIKEKYNELLDKEYKFSLINEINTLKEQCIIENNTEYLFKCNILISDIYIEHQNFNEALTLLLKDIKNVDKIIFKNIYLDFLDRLIYLYINKRNYNIALRYISDKEKELNPNDSDSFNRLFLEYSYVYGEVNKLDKSEAYLLKILSNYPDDNIKSVVLSNLTKIYIDKNDIANAKKYLNQCIAYSNDHESEVYNDYLLAKICVLEGKEKEGLQLYDNIFVNEEINSMTLAMMNDYLKLLNSLKKYNKSLLLMNKLSLFINATDDLYIINSFYHNKLDYFIALKDNNNITITMKEIEAIEKQISDNEKNLLNANLEEDKKDIEEKTKVKTFNQIDLLTNLVDTALKGNTLREIIMDFSSKVQKIINFDELQFILFNRVNEKEYQISNEINCFRYKNNRLFEKNIAYEDLKGSIVEMLINTNKPIAIDFTNCNLDIKDLFNNKIYNKEENRYLNCLPCLYKDDTFAVVIYSSKSNDLTDYSNSILLKIATKMLESPLIIQFVEENISRVENLNNFIVNNNKIGLFQINNNTLYLSNELKELLQLKHSSISIESFKKHIFNSDLNKYNDHLISDTKSIIQYKYQLNDKIIELYEIIEPVTDFNGKVLYRQGMIKSLESESNGYALSMKDLIKKIEDLKKNINDIAFKFSLIKIQGIVDEYEDIKKSFGLEPFYLNDGSFIVILENEVNQRTLDKLCKDYINRSSIVRFPRDVINIDEMLDISSMMLESHKHYFTNDVYREFVKKNNLSNRIDSILDKELKLMILSFKCFDNSKLYEIKPAIFGFDEKDNIYKYLSSDLLRKYENKFLDTFMKLNFIDNCIFPLSNNSIYKLFTEYDLSTIAEIDVIMYEFNKITPAIIEKCKTLHKQIYIDYSLISQLDAYYLTTGVIKGIYIGNNVNVDVNKLFRLLSMFNLRLLCYNDAYDYDKVCYYNNKYELLN